MISSVILIVSILVAIGLVALVVIARRTMNGGPFVVTAILSTLVIALSAFIFVTNLSYFDKNRTGLAVVNNNVTSSDLKFNIEELEDGVFAIHNAKDKEVVVKKEGGKTYKMHNDTFTFVYNSDLEPGIYETKINRTHNYWFFGKKSETVEYKAFAVVLSEDMVKPELGNYNANKSLSIMTKFESIAIMFGLALMVLNILILILVSKEAISHSKDFVLNTLLRAAFIMFVVTAIFVIMSIILY